MNYNIEYSPLFEKDLKRLSKKYPSLKSDIQKFNDNIHKELELGADLGGGFKKIRLNISSKDKEKSGGGRIISYETIVSVFDKNVVLVLIYDKSEHESISIDVLKRIVQDWEKQK